MSATGGDLIYSTGFDSNVGVIAVAGIDPNVTMGAVPVTGTANFSGTVGWNGGASISTNGNAVSYSPFVNNDTISMTADFDNGTLTGTSSNTFVTVNGTFNSSSLGGSVTFFGMNGSVEGVVGANGAAGVFHGGGTTGASGNTVFSGGFVVN